MDSEQFYTVLDMIDFDFEKHLTVRAMFFKEGYHDIHADDACGEITNGSHIPYKDYSFETVRGKLCEMCFGSMVCIYRKNSKNQVLSMYDLKNHFSGYARLYENFKKALPEVKDVISLAKAYENLHVFQEIKTSYAYNKEIPDGHISNSILDEKKILFIDEVTKKAQKDFLKVESELLKSEKTNVDSFFKNLLFEKFPSFENYPKANQALILAQEIYFQEVNESEEKFLLLFKDVMQIPTEGKDNFIIWLKRFLVSKYTSYFDAKTHSYLLEVPLLIKELLNNLPSDPSHQVLPFILPLEKEFKKEHFENFKGLQDLNNINNVDDFKEAVFVAVNV